MRATLAFLAAFSLAFAARGDLEEDRARAKAFYEKGEAEYNLGHFQGALKNYEEAYKIRSVPRLLFNIAQCHRQLGDMRSAVATYKAFLRTAAANDPGRKNAQALLGEVESALKKQESAQHAPPLDTAPKPDEPPSAEPTVTAEPAAKPEPPAEPKPVEEKPAEPPGVKVAAAEPKAAIEPAAVARPLPAPPAQRQRLYTWVAGGATVVALGAGAMFGLKSKSGASDLESKAHTRAEIDRLSEAVKSDAGKANLLFGVGAALAVATGALFVLRF